MAHPYISGAGSVTAIITHLRKTFPATVNADFIKKLGLARHNESYLINILVFLGIIDEEGKRTDKGRDVLAIHKDDEFQKAFGALVNSSYSDLFSTLGEDAWSRDRDSLVNYFRQADKSSDIIGRRQTGTFLALAALSGRGELPPESAKSRPASAKPKAAAAAKSAEKKVEKKVDTVVGKQEAENGGTANGGMKSGMALTVRIEINLPPGGTQDTYDAIFRSIRANLIDE